MAQHDYIISNAGFPATRADINGALSAIATNNTGTSAPSTQYAGQFWIDTTSSTWTMFIHDGADDIQFATIDTSANTVNFTDSALDVVTDTTPQLGGNLDLNSNDITGTGNINITGTVTATSFSGDGSALTGITAGDVVDDTTPQLGGDLDLNSNDITGTGNINITGTIESSGNITGTLATASQTNITSVGTLTSFSSTGIDDNATANALTIDSSSNLQFNSGFGSVATAYGVRAWVNFNGTGTVAIRDSGNVSSITDNGTGDYTINFATNMPDANYTFIGTPSLGSGETVARSLFFKDSDTRSVSAIQVNVQQTGGTANRDNSFIEVAFFR